ncbi:MAG: biopolymer transporter ExbD [Mariniphaga sp.]|nr:biopolymer transporter ExbD [Mariniphaga sp.]
MMARKIPQVNAGSMADIAFLLLIFFLVTTTMDIDTGIMRQLPPPPDPNQDIPRIKERNIMNILVSRSDRLLVNKKVGNIKTLKNDVIDFMSIHHDDQLYPEVTLKSIDYIGDVYTTKGIVSLKNDRGTSYDMYIQVQNELAAAFKELRDRLSMEKFGRKYDKLINEDYIDAINKAVPVRVSEAEPEDVGGS